MGEYARSLAIAQAAAVRWPGATVHFMLSRRAPYAAASPFPSTLLDASPTFHTPAVIETIQRLKPDVVVFDNAGRTAQLRAARRAGARIVFISARLRQRRKAFRWRWLQLIDEHWIAYPEFIAGRLSLFERLKLHASGHTLLRFLDVILARPAAPQHVAVAERHGLQPGEYILVVPGGGTGHPGAQDAVAQFARASRELAESGIPCVFVGALTETSSVPSFRSFASLPQADLAELMRGAGALIANGGSTLLQGIACGIACIAVPIAHDQRDRIRRCVEASVAIAAPLDAAAIASAATRLWRDVILRQALALRARNLRLADGVDVALQGLDRLLSLK
jgi:hypothetical protein